MFRIWIDISVRNMTPAATVTVHLNIAPSYVLFLIFNSGHVILTYRFDRRSPSFDR